MEQLRRAQDGVVQGIYDGIEAEAQRQRRGLGNGQRGGRGWKQGEKGQGEGVELEVNRAVERRGELSKVAHDQRGRQLMQPSTVM